MTEILYPNDCLCYSCNKMPKFSEKFTCGHLLCELCLLRTCLKFNKSYYDTDLIIYCSKCDNGSYLNANDFVSDLMYEKNLICSQQLCESCEEAPSEYACEKCETQFCKQCFDSYHSTNLAFSTHNVNKKVFITDENLDKVFETTGSIMQSQVTKTPNHLGSVSEKNSKLSFLKERRQSMQQKRIQDEKAKKLNVVKNNEIIVNYFKKLFSEYKSTINCFCPLKQPAKFRCLDCDVKICEVCLLTVHKTHLAKFETNVFSSENKYENPKYLELISQRSNEGDISPKNEIIKNFEKEKPKPSIHHSSVKVLTKVDYESKKDYKLSLVKPVEVVRNDYLYLEAITLSKKLIEMSNYLYKCYELRMDRMDEISNYVKNDISLIVEQIAKMLKNSKANANNNAQTANNRTSISYNQGQIANTNNELSPTNTNNINANNTTSNSKTMSYNNRLAIELNFKNKVKEDEKVLDKLFGSLKSHIKELQSLIDENSEGNLISKNKVNKNNLDPNKSNLSYNQFTHMSPNTNTNINNNIDSSNLNINKISGKNDSTDLNNTYSSNPFISNKNLVKDYDIDCLSVDKIQQIKQDVSSLNETINKNEKDLINLFFGHISNNPYVSQLSPSIKENILVDNFENIDMEKEEHEGANLRKPLRKITKKNFRDSGVVPSCDLLRLSGYQIISSSNMSKDSFPSMMAVFQTSMNRDFLTYINNLNYEIIVIEFNPEFKFKKDSLKKFFLNSKIKLRGHVANVNCLKYYFFRSRDILFSCSEDGTIKGWDCSDFRLEMNISFGDSLNEPVYSLSMATLLDENYLLIGAYSKNAPIKIYNNLQGIIMRYLEIEGYTYHIENYIDESNDCRFIFVSVLNKGRYHVLLFDFGTGEKIYKFNTKSYVNSFVMSYSNESTLFLTMMDRTGTIYRYNFSGYQPILVLERSGFGYYGLIKWDSNYMISIGKETSMEIINMETLKVEKNYNLAHEDSVRNLCKFKHNYLGYVIFTYGEDQTIKMFK